MIALLPLAADSTDSAAQQWVREELAKSKYHEHATLLSKIIKWLKENLTIRFDQSTSQGAATAIVILLALVAAAVLGVLLWRAFRSRASSAPSEENSALGSLFSDRRSAEQLLSAAEQARANGNFDRVVVELFRAAIRLLSEHGRITLYPGLTATEAAHEAAAAIGGSALLNRGADWFNRVFFAGLHAPAEAVADLDKLVAFVRASIAAASTPAQATRSIPTEQGEKREEAQ